MDIPAFLLTGDQFWVGGVSETQAYNPSVPGGGSVGRSDPSLVPRGDGRAANPGGQRVNLAPRVRAGGGWVVD